ncbi:hypothetical protein L7F22_047160 [Adiantum nelumboides]|nr:hypothetical protein [Adiantum nelumboides]
MRAWLLSGFNSKKLREQKVPAQKFTELVHKALKLEQLVKKEKSRHKAALSDHFASLDTNAALSDHSARSSRRRIAERAQRKAQRFERGRKDEEDYTDMSRRSGKLAVEEFDPEWMEVQEFLQTGKILEDWPQSRKMSLIVKSLKFTIIGNCLYRLGIGGVLRRCVPISVRMLIITEAHTGSSGLRGISEEEISDTTVEETTTLEEDDADLQHDIAGALEPLNAEYKASTSESTEQSTNKEGETSIQEVLLSSVCVLVTPKRKLAGRLDVTADSIHFYGDFLVEGTGGSSVFTSSGQINYSEHTALDLVEKRLAGNKEHTNLEAEQSGNQDKADYVNPAASSPQAIKGIKRHHCWELLKLVERYKDCWQRREINNFEYLMHLNTLAGRSYNDLTQYPIFSWIISDYTSETLDLSSSSSFRDLSKPIGALDEKRFETFEERFQNFTDPDIPSFYYGSHYSSMGIVLFYLLRLEPFTSLHQNLQVEFMIEWLYVEKLLLLAENSQCKTFCLNDLME